MLHGAGAENPTETLPAPFAPVHTFARSPDKGIDALLNVYLFDADASGEASGTSKEEHPLFLLICVPPPSIPQASGRCGYRHLTEGCGNESSLVKGHKLTLHHRMPYFSNIDVHCVRQENKTEREKGPLGRIMTTPTMWMDASALVLALARRLGSTLMGYFRSVLDCTVGAVAKWKFCQPALDAENLAPAHRSAA